MNTQRFEYKAQQSASQRGFNLNTLFVCLHHIHHSHHEHSAH